MVDTLKSKLALIQMMNNNANNGSSNMQDEYFKTANQLSPEFAALNGLVKRMDDNEISKNNMLSKIQGAAYEQEYNDENRIQGIADKKDLAKYQNGLSERLARVNNGLEIDKLKKMNTINNDNEETRQRKAIATQYLMKANEIKRKSVDMTDELERNRLLAQANSYSALANNLYAGKVSINDALTEENNISINDRQTEIARNSNEGAKAIESSLSKPIKYIPDEGFFNSLTGTDAGKNLIDDWTSVKDNKSLQSVENMNRGDFVNLEKTNLFAKFKTVFNDYLPVEIKMLKEKSPEFNEYLNSIDQNNQLEVMDAYDRYIDRIKFKTALGRSTLGNYDINYVPETLDSEMQKNPTMVTIFSENLRKSGTAMPDKDNFQIFSSKDGQSRYYLDRKTGKFIEFKNGRPIRLSQADVGE